MYLLHLENEPSHQRLEEHCRGRNFRRRAITFLFTFVSTLVFSVLTPAVLGPTNTAMAADPANAREAFYRGDYDTCIDLCRKEVDRGVWNVFWCKQLIYCLLEVGRYDEAVEVYESVRDRYPSSLRLRELAAQAYRYSGDAATGDQMLDQILELASTRSWQFRDIESILTIGDRYLAVGEDARDVLALYDVILKQEPDYADAHLAIAKLALTKSDFQEAAKSLKRAAEIRPEDPQVHYLLYQAWSPSDSQRASQSLQAALQINSRHIPSLLVQVESAISSESFDAAEKIIAEVLQINVKHPVALSLRAAIAHLQGEYALEEKHRREALSTWKLNPEVDFTIGKVLSRHYRFSESVNYQRRALTLSPRFQPARFQLAQDLLRLGKTAEGWELVDQVATQDKYNVVAYNLKTLRKRLESFTTLRTDAFILRMQADEAKLYGSRVLLLLEEARERLTSKYDVQLSGPITVEIFPEQSDFAIRTFGLPGGAGFLGVCFGSLITANSPASQGDQPSNLESVLWHEFCHVVTLQKTNNKMPRWLSEGISVYEEVQRDPSWGERMNLTYRGMILGEDYVPLSQLSSAFLSPKSPLHLQFAYFESALAIEYLIKVHGIERLRRLLVDLGVGMPSHEAFERHYGQAKALDEDFKKFASSRAEQFGASVDLKDVELENPSLDRVAAFLKSNPENYFARLTQIRLMLADGQNSSAVERAKELADMFPEDFQSGGAIASLAIAARAAEDTELEIATLQRIAEATSNDLQVLRRLITLYSEQKDWQRLAETAERFLAVQPLVQTGYQAKKLAASELGDSYAVVEAAYALQQLDPTDPILLDFELASAYFKLGDLVSARDYVLRALEASPRYREALVLLRQIHHERTKINVRKASAAAAPIPN